VEGTTGHRLAEWKTWAVRAGAPEEATQILIKTLMVVEVLISATATAKLMVAPADMAQENSGAMAIRVLHPLLKHLVPRAQQLDAQGQFELWILDTISRTSEAEEEGTAEARLEVMAIRTLAMESMTITMISRAKTQRTIQTQTTENPSTLTTCRPR